MTAGESCWGADGKPCVAPQPGARRIKAGSGRLPRPRPLAALNPQLAASPIPSSAYPCNTPCRFAQQSRRAALPSSLRTPGPSLHAPGPIVPSHPGPHDNSRQVPLQSPSSTVHPALPRCIDSPRPQPMQRDALSPSPPAFGWYRPSEQLDNPPMPWCIALARTCLAPLTPGPPHQVPPHPALTLPCPAHRRRDPPVACLLHPMPTAFLPSAPGSRPAPLQPPAASQAPPAPPWLRHGARLSHLWKATTRSVTCCGSRPATFGFTASANFLKPAGLL